MPIVSANDWKSGRVRKDTNIVADASQVGYQNQRSKQGTIIGRANQYEAAGFGVPQQHVQATQNYAAQAATPDAVAGQQTKLSDLLFRSATGQVPSAAERMLRLAGDRAYGDQVAIASGARGNSASAYRTASRNLATITGDLAQQGAIQRAAEQESARTALIQALNIQRGQNIQGAATGGELQLGLGELEANQLLQLLNAGMETEGARQADKERKFQRGMGAAKGGIGAAAKIASGGAF